MISLDTRAGLLKKIHLFHDVSDGDIKAVAEKFSEVTYNEGDIIFDQGARAENFYLIFSGRVRIVSKKNGREEQLATLVSNDYFGEMALVSNRPRSATVTALATTTVLTLSLADFNTLIRKQPHLKTNLDVTIRSRALARTLSFKWLRSDEVIYFLARKHPVLLYQAMVAPALFLVVPLALAVFSVLTNSISPAAVAVVLLLVDLGWAGWQALDWSNDYYVVTNERVVWVEKVVGIYDSRQEAPLSTILSVGVETDAWGRVMDYGNVIVRTFVGQIPFKHVSHPTQASKAIEEYWQRTKQGAVHTEKEAMKNAIRSKLGLPVGKKPEPAKAAAPAARETKRPVKAMFLRALGASTLKLRYEIGDTVIYRKHWVVLFGKIWQAAFAALLLVFLLIWRIVDLALSPDLSFIWFSEAGDFRVDTPAVSLPILILPFIGWIIYQVVDWSNDIFQVTLDQIIDIDKKPFGSEERRASQLENILGTNYKREGLLSNIFNFGTVFITVGGSQLAFEDVVDPATVQSDIDRRRMARMAKANESKVVAERERMAEWLAAYHINADEFRRDTDNKNG